MELCFDIEYLEFIVTIEPYNEISGIPINKCIIFGKVE